MNNSYIFQIFYESDRQNERVNVISEDIARHEQMVQDIKALLLQQSVELLKVTQDNHHKKSKFLGTLKSSLWLEHNCLRCL